MFPRSIYFRCPFLNTTLHGVTQDDVRSSIYDLNKEKALIICIPSNISRVNYVDQVNFDCRSSGEERGELLLKKTTHRILQKRAPAF